MSSNEDVMLEDCEKSGFGKSDLDTQLPDLDSDFFGPALPPHLLTKGYANRQSTIKTFGPVLPDYLRNNEDLQEGASLDLPDKNAIVIGPALPEQLCCNQSVSEEGENTDESDDTFGPSADLMASREDASSYQYMSRQSISKKAPEHSPVKRETWMTELPEKRRTNFGFLPRKFKSQIPTDKESDDSVWTDTPTDKEKKHTSKKDHTEALQLKRLQERDKQMEKLAKKAAKKLRKKKSLLEVHLKNKKKKKEKEATKLQEKGKSVPERRPFDRNIDLQVRKFDENKRRAILSKSHFLNDRFAQGQSKFL